jgi:hypothetical protein
MDIRKFFARNAGETAVLDCRSRAAAEPHHVYNVRTGEAPPTAYCMRSGLCVLGIQCAVPPAMAAWRITLAISRSLAGAYVVMTTGRGEYLCVPLVLD